jgi:uncharacterized protein (DUF2141 family)
MHRRVLNAFFLGAAAVIPVQAADLTINVTDIEPQQGTLRLSLFDSADSYSTGATPRFSAMQRVDRTSTKVTIHELPSGRYAVKLYHDENNNGQLDSNALGMPSEGYGFSNNAGRFGPPSFDDAAVELDHSRSIEIRVR